MFGKKTRVSIKYNRLTIFAQDAQEPGVTTMALDHAMSGNFELASQNNGLTALVFKPSGKKTLETLAVYDRYDKGARALQSVFRTLNRGRGEGSLFWKIVKIVVIIIVAVVAAQWLITAYGFMLLSDDGTKSGASVVGASGQVLPVGEPMTVDDFVLKTQSTPTDQGTTQP